jgi:hypothetical protein
MPDEYGIHFDDFFLYPKEYCSFKIRRVIGSLVLCVMFCRLLFVLYLFLWATAFSILLRFTLLILVSWNLKQFQIQSTNRQVFRKGRQSLPHMWYPLCYFATNSVINHECRSNGFSERQTEHTRGHLWHKYSVT